MAIVSTRTPSKSNKQITTIPAPWPGLACDGFVLPCKRTLASSTSSVCMPSKPPSPLSAPYVSRRRR